MKRKQGSLILSDKGIAYINRVESWKTEFLSMLKERHPQLRGVSDDAKWGGKALQPRCPECGLHYQILNQDLETMIEWLILEVERGK